MEAANLVALPLIGAFGGAVAGLVGSGGGVLTLPLLIYLVAMPTKVATGVSATQYFFAALSGVVAHGQERNVHFRAGATMGAVGILLAQIGAVISGWMPDAGIKLLYLVEALLAAVLLLLPTRAERLGIEQEHLEAANLALAAVLGAVVGLMAGILGVGGGFLMVPLLVYVVGMPTRQAIGTSLFVIVGTSASAFVGKLLQGQVELLWAALVTVGAIAGAQAGARLSKRFPPAQLRKVLSVLIFLICLRIVADIAAGGAVLY